VMVPEVPEVPVWVHLFVFRMGLPTVTLSYQLCCWGYRLGLNFWGPKMNRSNTRQTIEGGSFGKLPVKVGATGRCIKFVRPQDSDCDCMLATFATTSRSLSHHSHLFCESLLVMSKMALLFKILGTGPGLAGNAPKTVFLPYPPP
jgi:hypothetical protein